MDTTEIEKKSEEREESRNRVWEEDGEPLEVAGIKLRTFTFRSFMRAANELKLSIVLCGEEDFEQIPDTQVLQEVMTVAWMQSEDPAEVKRVFRAGEEAIEEAVEDFEDRVDFRPGPIHELISEVLRVVLQAKVSWVQIIQRDESKKVAEDAPGN